MLKLKRLSDIKTNRNGSCDNGCGCSHPVNIVSQMIPLFGEKKIRESELIESHYGSGKIVRIGLYICCEKWFEKERINFNY